MPVQTTGRWAELMEIGGVEFTGCRGELIDGGDFFDRFVGSYDQGNDGTIDVQVVDRGTKGIAFGLKLTSTRQSKVQDVLAAIDTAQQEHESIIVEITDGLIEIEINATRDYTQTFFSYSKYSEGYYEDVVLRFLSLGDV